jgi:hypothetical protein
MAMRSPITRGANLSDPGGLPRAATYGLRGFAVDAALISKGVTPTGPEEEDLMLVADVEPISSTGVPTRDLWITIWSRSRAAAVVAVDRLVCALCGLRGHAMVRHFEPARMSLVCLSCGHNTPGWTMQQHSTVYESRSPTARSVKTPYVRHGWQTVTTSLRRVASSTPRITRSLSCTARDAITAMSRRFVPSRSLSYGVQQTEYRHVAERKVKDKQ